MNGRAEASPTVGGSYYLCIDPSAFGPIAQVKLRSDEYVQSVRETKPRPGHFVRVPGSAGYRAIQNQSNEVEVLENHWVPFFENIAANYGLSEKILREEFAAEGA